MVMTGRWNIICYEVMPTLISSLEFVTLFSPLANISLGAIQGQGVRPLGPSATKTGHPHGGHGGHVQKLHPVDVERCLENQGHQVRAARAARRAWKPGAACVEFIDPKFGREKRKFPWKEYG